MGNWRGSLSSEEVQEVYEDACAAFQDNEISEKKFRQILGELGHNATDIDDAVKFYRPEPSENSDGEAD